jgi:hypothetical protein
MHVLVEWKTFFCADIIRLSHAPPKLGADEGENIHSIFDDFTMAIWLRRSIPFCQDVRLVRFLECITSVRIILPSARKNE